MSINRISASVPAISNVAAQSASSAGSLTGLKAADAPVRARAGDLLAKGPGFDSGRKDIASGVQSKVCNILGGNEYRSVLTAMKRES